MSNCPIWGFKSCMVWETVQMFLILKSNMNFILQAFSFLTLRPVSLLFFLKLVSVTDAEWRTVSHSAETLWWEQCLPLSLTHYILCWMMRHDGADRGPAPIHQQEHTHVLTLLCIDSSWIENNLHETHTVWISSSGSQWCHSLLVWCLYN